MKVRFFFVFRRDAGNPVFPVAWPRRLLSRESASPLGVLMSSSGWPPPPVRLRTVRRPIPGYSESQKIGHRPIFHDSRDAGNRTRSTCTPCMRTTGILRPGCFNYAQKNASRIYSIPHTEYIILYTTSSFLLSRS